MIPLALVLLGLQAALPRDELPADLFTKTPPLGLPAEVPGPAKNPLTKASFELGRRLFFDPLLSLDRTVSCASCHQPAFGYSSPDALPIGVHGKKALRNAPTLFNRGFGRRQSWDGRAATLEEQVLLPIENPVEMDLPLEKALTRIRASETYRRRFAETWQGGITEQNLSRALASFVRGLMLGDSLIDRFRGGQLRALGPDAKAGLWLYESKGGCWRCHSGPNFSDEKLHNTGVGVRDGKPEAGRFAISGEDTDRGRFKTPTLRGLAQTAPYMHDGSLRSLRDVVHFYRRGGNENRWLDPAIRPLALSDEEVSQLVAFLEALSPADIRPASARKRRRLE
ncbi:MAG: cytochrome-c peroxidase [Planctomycetota bacterium]